MFINKAKWTVLAAAVTGFAFTSAVVLGRQAAEQKGGPSVAQATPSQLPPPDRQKSSPGAPTGPPPVTKKAATKGVSSNAVALADDPKSRQVLEKLEEPISMSFAHETPIDDVLKYIKQATTSPTYNGIPIYVDPYGLQDAERSMNSTVQMDLEGIPLKRTLQLLLKQLDLVYFVEDGFLIITSEDRAREALPPAMATPAPIAKMVEKSERGELTSAELKELVEVFKLRRQVKLMDENFDAPPPGRPASDHGGGGSFGGGDSRRFPGEENISDTRELLTEVRELIRLLKEEKGRGAKDATVKKSAETP